MTGHAETVILAFSGGLDTSYSLLELKRRGYAVHTVFVDTGGISEADKQAIADRAKALGTDQHHSLHAADELWDEFVKPLVWSHGRANDEYPLLCSDRYLIVRKCLELADEIGARIFAHGCTAMGNDQLRFDQTVRSLGNYEILAPIRELQAETRKVRDYEMVVLREAGHSVPVSNQAYSINQNLLGVTISGSEIDEFKPPALETWTLCRPRKHWPTEPLQLTIGFEQGVAVSVNGVPMTGPKILALLNEQCGAYGVGRHIYTGDVTIGLKGRIVFECPGIDALLTAHKALEDAVNTRWQNQFRHFVAKRWTELVYTGFFYEPHKMDLEAYLRSSQRHVSGTVTLQTDGGVLLPVAIDSPHILIDAESVYAQTASWTPEEANGFIKLIGQSSTLSAKINGVAKSGGH
jgi:argininosuccinate synthase